MVLPILPLYLELRSQSVNVFVRPGEKCLVFISDFLLTLLVLVLFQADFIVQFNSCLIIRRRTDFFDAVYVTSEIITTFSI